MTTRTYIGGPTLLVAADAITDTEFYNEGADAPTGVYIATEEGFLTSENPADVEGFRTELRRLEEGGEPAPEPNPDALWLSLMHARLRKLLRLVESEENVDIPMRIKTLLQQLRRRIDEKQAPTEHTFVGGKQIFVHLSDIQSISIREDAGPDPVVNVHLRNGGRVSSQHPKDVSVFSRVAGRMPPDTARGHKEERE